MKRFYHVIFAVIFGVFVLAAPLHAQDGCTDSPENPTVILGLAGVAGAGLAQLRIYMKKK